MNQNQSYAFSYRERQTKKKGIVYDIIFRIVNEDGCEVQKSLCGFQTKKLAKQAYTEFMSTYIAPPKRYKGKTKITFEFALENYYSMLSSTVKESSVYTIKNVFENHIAPFFANRDMVSIKEDDIYAWQDTLWTKKKKDGTLYSQRQLMKVRNTFATFLRFCTKRYKINNPLEYVDHPNRKSQKSENTIWTKEQFMQFYSVIYDERYKALFYTLFFSGIRCGELQALTPADFTGTALTIKATFTQKTMDGSPYKITETKNYKKHIVPLPNHAQTVLSHWLSQNPDNVYIFGTSTPISRHAIQNALEKYTALAELPKIRIHDFRHSYVSMLLSNGANFAVIAALIGDTIEQVVKTYSHLTKSDLSKAVDLL